MGTGNAMGTPVPIGEADVWGGHTVYDATRSRPGATAVIAVVGPVANLLLAGLGYVALPFVKVDGRPALRPGLAGRLRHHRRPGQNRRAGGPFH